MDIDPARQEMAKKYARVRRRLFFAELFLGGLFLSLLLVSDLSTKLRDLLDFPQPLRVALYFTIFMAAYSIILAPLTFHSSFTLPHRYGLSNQSLKSWLFDVAKAGVLGLALGITAAVVVYGFLATFPQVWWLLAAAFVILVTVMLTHLAPLLIVPIFFKLEPLSDLNLKKRLISLAEKAKVKTCGVFTMNLSTRSTAANAALAGLGNTRRIILGDTLLNSYSPEEIEVVMAHELGHHLHGDTPKLIITQALTTCVAFYLASLVLSQAVAWLGFQGIADVAALPWLALVFGIFSLFIRPLENAYSRNLERAADEYALKATDNPKAFVSAMTKLTDQNLSEAQPSPWVEHFFYDHPPYHKRVEQARRYATCAHSSQQITMKEDGDAVL